MLVIVCNCAQNYYFFIKKDNMRVVFYLYINIFLYFCNKVYTCGDSRTTREKPPNKPKHQLWMMR